MIFLIEYDRAEAKLIDLKPYDESDRSEAQAARLERELAVLRSGTNREVVLIEAPNQAALRRTHSRYFDDLEQMIDRLHSSTSAFVVREDSD